MFENNIGLCTSENILGHADDIVDSYWTGLKKNYGDQYIWTDGTWANLGFTSVWKTLTGSDVECSDGLSCCVRIFGK